MVLLGVVALGFLLRLWTLTALPLIETDGVGYVEIARQFQRSGSPFDPLFHPLYPLCIGALQPFVGDWELTGRLVSALFGTAVIVPTYGLTRALLDRSAATITALLVAVHPGLVRSSASVLSEPLYTFLLVVGAWAGWRGLVATPALLAVSGALFGLAYLVRPEAVLYVVGLSALAPIAGVRAGRMRERLLWAGASLALFLLLAGPYLVYLRGTLGHWTLSGKIIHNLVLDVNVPASGQGDLAFAARHASTLARRLAENVFLLEKYALGDLFPGVSILFLLPGILARVHESSWPTREGLLLALAVPPVATLVFHVESRVFLPSLPFLLPFLATGIVGVATWLSSARHRRWCLSGLVLVVVAGLAPYTLRPVLRPEPGEAVYRRVAQWVAASQPPGTAVMDRKPFVAFYSGRHFTPLVPVAPAELASAARRAGARLVVLDSRVLGDRPALVPLLYSAPPIGLEVAQDFDHAPGERVRVLRVSDGD